MYGIGIENKEKLLKQENHSPTRNQSIGQKKNTFSLQMGSKSMELSLTNSLNVFQLERVKM